MTQYGLHHYHKRKQKKLDVSVSTLANIVSKGAYIFGIVGIFMIIPQIYNVWVVKDVSGLSFITWVGFAGGALYWVIYGLAHKDKSITIVNTAFLFMYSLVTIGILIFQK